MCEGEGGRCGYEWREPPLRTRFREIEASFSANTCGQPREIYCVFVARVNRARNARPIGLSEKKTRRGRRRGRKSPGKCARGTFALYDSWTHREMDVGRNR